MDKDLKQYGQWLGGEKLESIKFLHNSYIEIITGAHTGNTGSVVSIWQYPPRGDVVYVVETENIGDVEVFESELALYSGGSGT